jgi:uncharacterized membrane protein (DUF4010 family)
VLAFHEYYTIAIASGVVLTLFLSLKRPLRSLVEHVSEAETLRHTQIRHHFPPSFSRYYPIRPWDRWMYATEAKLVHGGLIAGISFAGYVLVKVFFRSRKGWP